MSDAIPLPSHPNLEQYRKQAKDLLKACRANDVRAWVTRWIESWSSRWLETQERLSGKEVAPSEIRDLIERVERNVRDAKIAKLADAQHFLARAHGFASWPTFAKHLESPDANFEAAADAIVDGDLGALQRLLRNDPLLIRRRSKRTHRSTLLHYVSANGIEDFRQKTPANILEIAKLLLDAGADVDAESNAYGGRSTTFGLVATSVHPERAGVQVALMQLLLERGARIDRDAVDSCVANGRLEAARFLADRGEPLGLIGAAGIGRADLVARLLDEGADPTMQSGGMTALHWAAHYGHLDVVRVFIARNAPLEVANRYGGTVLGQAVWSSINDPQPDHSQIIDALIAAGAKVGEDWFTGQRPPLDEPLRRAHELRHRGDAHHHAGRNDLAAPLYAEALALYRAHDAPPLDLANVLRSAAVEREEAGAFDEAERLWEEAHRLYIATNVPPGVEESAQRLASLRSRR